MMENDLNNTIATNLSSLRKNKGLTQGEIAERFNYTDKSISKWEKGDSLPDVSVLKELADFYEVSLDYLVKPHSDDSLSNAAKRSPKALFKERCIFISLAICTIISIFSIAYIALRINNVKGWNSFQTFFWMIPSIFMTAAFFSRKWKWKTTFLVTSIAFFWTLCGALYLELGYDLGEKGWQCWFILLAPIPLTIGNILAGRIYKTSDNYIR